MEHQLIVKHLLLFVLLLLLSSCPLYQERFVKPLHFPIAINSKFELKNQKTKTKRIQLYTTNINTIGLFIYSISIAIYDSKSTECLRARAKVRARECEKRNRNVYKLKLAMVRWINYEYANVKCEPKKKRNFNCMSYVRAWIQIKN